jgi:hypothetical protein
MRQRIFYPNKLKKIILVAFNLKTTYFSGQKRAMKLVVLILEVHHVLSIWVFFDSRTSPGIQNILDGRWLRNIQKVNFVRQKSKQKKPQMFII